MEFPSVGKQCDSSDCKQLDFLPLTCKCGHRFCPEHFKIHLETCETNVSNVVDELTRIKDVYQCSQIGCNKTSLVKFFCEKCNKNFCIEHRHIECSYDLGKAEEFRNKNEEVKKQFENAKILVNKQIDENIAKAKLKGKNTQKIQLMRLKGKAVGLNSIPSVDRVYFNITHPKITPEKTTAIFVSKTWTLGRVIDAIADEIKITNKNNQANVLKLRLFKKETGETVSSIMSKKLEDLLKADEIVDGEELLIEYVSEDCKNINNV
nr:AN1-type zinc finger protein 1-like [Onthophagus taurus]